MKICVVVLLLILIYACKDERKYNKPEIITVANDSLQKRGNEDYFRIDTPFFLQKDILLESFEYASKDSCSEMSMTLPKRSESNAVIFKKINEIRKEAMKYYRHVDSEGMRPCDEMNQMYFNVTPMHLFQTGRFISYVIRTGSGYVRGTSSFENHAINFDLEKQREIQVSDFFRLKTHNDSFSLCKAISRSIDDEERLTKKGYESEWVMFLECSFAFDSDNVYCFFDRGGIVGWAGPIGVIRKKYLSAHINPRYQ